MRSIQNRTPMNSERTEQHVTDLYAMLREYEAELLVSSDPAQQHWLRRVITQLRATIIEIENAGDQ